MKRKRNSDQWWKNDQCRCECKKRHVLEKNYVWNPATSNCENGKYLTSIMDDSAIICDEVIDADADKEANSNNETNFNEKKQLSTAIALSIAVSIYCYYHFITQIMN